MIKTKILDLRWKLGNYEIDFTIGIKSSGFDNLITITEEFSRKTFLTRIISKKVMKINSIIYKVSKENNIIPKSITINNDIKFEKIYILASWLKWKVYYCESYAFYQRELNENVNELIKNCIKKNKF